MVLRPLVPAILVVLLSHTPAQAQQAADDCVRPWVVVVKNDGALVEGWLVKDAESGVLVDVAGRTVLVPEPEIREVVEDCERRATVSPLAPMQPGQPAQPAQPAPRVQRAPKPAAAAPASQSRLQAAESSTRNSVINFSQYFLRWGGGLCISCGGGLFTTGILFVVISAATQAGPPSTQSLLSLGTVLGVITAISAFIAGGGAAMVVSAQLTEFLRPSTAPAAAPVSDMDDDGS